MQQQNYSKWHNLEIKNAFMVSMQQHCIKRLGLSRIAYCLHGYSDFTGQLRQENAVPLRRDQGFIWEAEQNAVNAESSAVSIC